LTEGELRKYLGHHRMIKQIESHKGHTIIAGYGRVGALVCEGLTGSERPFVIIDQSPQRVPDMEAHGFLHLIGDATEESLLQEAGITRADVLVTALPSDADNVFLTLTARELAPELMIIARAEQAN